MITNPNDIVEELVADLSAVYGSRLLSVVMYGSAVSHEYRPGKSDVNIAILLTDASISTVRECVPALSRWIRRGVAVPLFLTPEYVASSLDTYPVEFLDIKQSHRILYGDDFLSGLTLRKHDLRLQCEREFRGLIIHLRKGFVADAARPRRLDRTLELTVRSLLPLFKAVLVLYDRKIPSSKAETIAAVEDLFGLGPSALSEINNRKRNVPDPVARYSDTVRIVEELISRIDRLSVETTGTDTKTTDG